MTDRYVVQAGPCRGPIFKTTDPPCTTPFVTDDPDRQGMSFAEAQAADVPGMVPGDFTCQGCTGQGRALDPTSAVPVRSCQEPVPGWSCWVEVDPETGDPVEAVEAVES